MSGINSNSIGSVLWGMRVATGNSGCGKSYGRDVIVLEPDEFGYAWRQTGVFMCSETNENPVLNEVKATESTPSLWHAVAEVVLKKTYPGKYAALNCGQREEAKKTVANLLTEKFKDQKLSDTMGWWGWTLRKNACKSSEPFPNRVNLFITKSEVEKALTDAETSANRGDCGMPTKIIQSLVLRQKVSFPPLKKAKNIPSRRSNSFTAMKC